MVRLLTGLSAVSLLDLDEPIWRLSRSTTSISLVSHHFGKPIMAIPLLGTRLSFW